ncbi:hypothetical protein [Amycolatopsis jejuensis]|nr:hypothetical protein [Amycolatopsis jejuensis]
MSVMVFAEPMKFCRPVTSMLVHVGMNERLLRAGLDRDYRENL